MLTFFDIITAAGMGNGMEFLKGITGKIITAGLALAVIAGAISWWRMDEPTRDMLVNSAGKIASWLGVVLVLPWATFFLISRIARIDSNAAGAMLILVYTALEIALLGWLFGWNISGATAWSFMVMSVLLAGVYNLFTCDWIAERLA